MRSSTMTDFIDPSICSCFSSNRNRICAKLKWSTLSIFMALLLIIMYATSGLYTLIDVTTFMSIESVPQENGFQSKNLSTKEFIEVCSFRYDVLADIYIFDFDSIKLDFISCLFYRCSSYDNSPMRNSICTKNCVFF